MFAGIAELTKKNGGYIYWRGIEVEHYSFDEDEESKEQEAAQDLAARCRHLEALGVPVRGQTAIWHWGWFKDMQPSDSLQPGDPLRNLLAQCPGLYQEGITKERSNAQREACVPTPEWTPERRSTGRIGWTIGRNFYIWDAERGDSYISRFKPDEDGAFYHILRAAGWDIADCGQAPHLGTCYATLEGVRAFLTAHGYPGNGA